MGIIKTIETALTKTEKIAALVKSIARHRKLYEAGKPAISDKAYDRLEEELRTVDPTNKLLKDVGAPVLIKNLKVKLPYPMLSLDKIKPEDENVDEWIENHEGKYVISDKLDGVSLLIVAKTGKKLKMYTRGRNNVGGDISFMIPYMTNLPKIKGDLVVRVEGILFNKTFQQSWVKDFENPRNMAAGITNPKTKKIHPALADMQFMAHTCYVPLLKPSAAYRMLKAKGFRVVPHIVKDVLTSEFLNKYFTQRKTQAKYDIDGLVIQQDIAVKPSFSSNPDTQVAYKEKGEVFKAKVIKVLWNITRHGYLKPTVEITPTRMGGVTVRKATAFNAAFIRDNKIGPGAIIKLHRSGDVIPDIESVVKPALKAQMPPLSLYPNVKWTATKIDLFVPDAIKNDESVIVQRFANFFAVMGIENIKIGTVSRLYEAGFTSMKSLLKGTPAKFMKAEGIQKTMADKIYKNIQEAIDGADLVNVAAATGFFGRGLGRRKIEAVRSVYPDMLALNKLSDSALYDKVLAVKGFEEKSIRLFISGLRRLSKWLPQTPITIEAPKKKKTKGKLAGQYVAFTGFRDSTVEDLITDNAGIVDSGIKTTTTILLVKDPAENTSKIKTARDKGIKIMTKQQFLKKYQLS